MTFRDRDLFRRDLFCGSGFFAFGVFRVGCPFVVKSKRDRRVTNLVTPLYGAGTTLRGLEVLEVSRY